MDNRHDAYDQPEKKQARWLALCHAVESLTTYRDSSPVVTLDHFQRGMKFVCDTLEEVRAGFPYPHQQVKKKAEAFAELHGTRIGRRTANALQVLFLSGPEPLNDLLVMLELGIRPENIWAVEADKDSFQQAVDSLTISGYGIKIHRGSLKQFFEVVPQQFDIIYFDACGALPSNKQSTTQVLRQLFERQRLAPLGALITNFSQANQDGKTLDLWAKRLGSWFFTRDDWEDFENDYFQHVSANLDDYYSSFVTRFVIEFGGLLMPWWRVAALDGARQEYFSPDFAELINLEPFHAERRKLEAAPEAAFLQDSFPEYRRVLEMIEGSLPKDDPLRKLFCEESINKVRLCDAIWLAYAMRNCGDPGFSATSDLNKKLCSEKVVESLNYFRWLDQGVGIFCDEPRPNLLADLLLGLYGYPYHCNVEKQRRWRYTASGKVTPMYLDVFVFDQARYFYDLIPTLPFLTDRLRFSEQWMVRVCMDGIFRHTAHVCREWFFASTLAGMGMPGFKFHELPPRETIIAEKEVPP
jgi:hypothetical protein